MDPQTKTKIEIERSCTAGDTKKNLHAVDEEQDDFFGRRSTAGGKGRGMDTSGCESDIPC